MTRLQLLWLRVRGSLWFIPSVLTAVSIALAMATVRLDRAGVFDPSDNWLLFGAGAEGARGVLSTIAGSIITVTGVVFSITIVVLQLASSQFTPRVLQGFTNDRSNQAVLGVFIGTFTYALLVLRTVRSSYEDNDRFVPALSVTVAVVLALVSVGFLIYFMNHVARSMQAEVVLDRAAVNAQRVVEQLFPEELARGSEDEAASNATEAQPAAVRNDKPGYLQGIAEDKVLQLAEKHAVLIRMEVKTGDFLLPGAVVFSVWPASAPAEVLSAVADMATIGPDRTREQDLDRSLIEITDIGVRALSPGLNDPTTAMVSIDRLAGVLAVLSTRRFPALSRAGKDGQVRFIARRSSFGETVAAAYRSLIHHSARDPVVSAHLAASLRSLLELVPPERREPFRAELRLVEESSRGASSH